MRYSTIQLSLVIARVRSWNAKKIIFVTYYYVWSRHSISAYYYVLQRIKEGKRIMIEKNRKESLVVDTMPRVV